MGLDPTTSRRNSTHRVRGPAELVPDVSAGASRGHSLGPPVKGAHIPLYVWLPDAIAGPTPVSALIHAATMVTAGVYMIVRCSAIYVHAPTAMFIVAIIGALTALFAATIGLAQNDIKKVLAYSTISQLGYMFLACGLGAFTAAIFHVITHAFFKALLFLGSGSVIHGMHHEQDMRRMGGLRKYMPITFATMLTGWLAISGIPIFAGFFSKDEILWKTWSASSFALPSPAWSKLLWGIGALTALLTAVYMTRMMVMTFWGTERFREHLIIRARGADDGLARPLTTTPTTLITAFEPHSRLADDRAAGGAGNTLTVGGFIGVPYALSSLLPGHPENYIERILEPAIAEVPGGSPGHAAEAEPILLSPPPQAVDGPPAIAPLNEHNGGEAFHSPEEIREERLLALLSVLIAALGIAIGWTIFKKRPLLEMPRLLENKYYVDEIYDAVIINPINVGSREGLWKLFDVGVIDGLLHGLGEAVTETGRFLRQLQSGFVRSYAAVILLGALALVGVFAYYGVQALSRLP